MELALKKGVTIILDVDGEIDHLDKTDSTYSYDKSSKILCINVPNLKVTDKEFLFEIIRKVHEDDGLLWEDSKTAALNSYAEYYTKSNKNEILSFFQGYLSVADYTALKMSLFIRYQAKKGRDVNMFKKDIRDKFGDRGANISNLCSSGYFEDEFMPLLKNGGTIQDFQTYYEMAVGAKARALFVHASMSVNDIEKEINIMAEKAIRYHMDDFRVHGRGRHNIDNIEKYVKSISEETDLGFEIKKAYYNERLSVVEYIVEITRE
ncbi:MAG TPA: hypothetical protein VF411_07275 [Bacteroidia bacterium]